MVAKSIRVERRGREINPNAAALREMATIQGILNASNHFDLLRLPKPTADLLGEPVWDVSEADVHRAFRKTSLCCHPDKATHADAPRAFEALKAAKKCLADANEREDYCRRFLEEQKYLWQGSWSSAEEAAGSKARESALRHVAQQDQEDDVLDAARERRARAEILARQRQRKAAAAQRARAREPDDRGLVEEEEEEDSGVRPSVAPSSRAPAAGAGAKARKRPKFL